MLVESRCFLGLLATRKQAECAGTYADLAATINEAD
jgi:hypothetical protein